MIVPTGHRVLIKPRKIEEIDDAFKNAKAAGIIIQEATSRQEQTAVDVGFVIKLGPTAFKDFGGDPWCEVGDLIAYAKYSGKALKENDEDFIVLNDEDIVAVYKED